VRGRVANTPAASHTRLGHRHDHGRYGSGNEDGQQRAFGRNSYEFLHATADAVYCDAKRLATTLRVPERMWPPDRAAFDGHAISRAPGPAHRLTAPSVKHATPNQRVASQDSRSAEQV